MSTEQVSDRDVPSMHIVGGVDAQPVIPVQGFPEIRDAVVVVWTLTFDAQAQVHPRDLNELRENVISAANGLNCKILLDEATNGVILGQPMEAQRMNSSDTAVRLAQLLCRWGSKHRIPIRCGVALGSVLGLAVSDGRTSFYGPALAEAYRLALNSAKDSLVHMSRDVKEHLSALRLMRVTISPNRASYYLDAGTTVASYFARNAASICSEGATVDRLTMSLAQIERIPPDGASLENGRRRSIVQNDQMSYTEFCAMLARFKVDMSQFGRGTALTLEEFYNSVVKEQKSYLAEQDGVLERFVNLVRISLRIRDDDNKLRELRIKTQKSGNYTRVRDQPLAITLKLSDKTQWTEAIERCFAEKLQISAPVHRENVIIDLDAYSLQEERSISTSVPGMATTYTSHCVVANIKDKSQKALNFLGLPGATDFNLGDKTWTWATVEDSREDELMRLLQTYGVDVAEFSAQAFAELFDEVYRRMIASLEVRNKQLVRTVWVIKVWLHANILNVDHVLVMKCKMQRGRFDEAVEDAPISMIMPVDHDWTEAVQVALHTRLGLTPSFQASNLVIDNSSHKVSEEITYSKSYPGLLTTYIVNEVNAHILDTKAGGLCHFIGLPSGTDFNFSRQQAVKGPQAEDAIVTMWTWRVEEEIGRRAQLHAADGTGASDVAAQLHTEADDELEMISVRTISSPDLGLEERRVPPPTPLVLSKEKLKGSVGALKQLLDASSTNWARARHAAENIRNPGYTCKAFHDDLVAAFPELRLYCVDGASTQGTLSGRTSDDEYQRTLGALFVFFWMMRLDMGGKESFCFGLKKSWKPRMEAEKPSRQADEIQKRLAFMANTKWDVLERLMLDAELLRSGEASDGGLVANTERTLAMMCLLAIHDIMKVDGLQPVVEKEVGEFCGYKVGETIGDHDVALSYVLTHHPQVLPSFSGLNQEQKQSVMFTHCKLEYNMGWLVQGEAPPGILFRPFKAAIQAGKAPSRDIAFYFAHWLADLGAAEPTPLEGAEKFVLKFPQRVLLQFCDSFSIVQLLGTPRTETEVLEEYLASRWRIILSAAKGSPELIRTHSKQVGRLSSTPEEPPTGPGSIAKMRILLMCQGDPSLFLHAMRDLPEEDCATLSEEMSRTGIRNQAFARERATAQGPAFLVYYGPALLQRAGKNDPVGALRILAEVYRKARQLWPLTDDAADNTVTIRIDALKELETAAIFSCPGNLWLLQRTSGRDAMVKMQPVSILGEVDFSANVVLSFTRPSVTRARSVARAGAVVQRKVAVFSPFRRKKGPPAASS